MKTPFYIFGAGGHGKCILEAARASGQKVSAILDDVPSVTSLYGIPIFAANEFPFDHSFRFVVAIGNCQVRREKFELLRNFGGVPHTIIHPRAYVSPSAKIGQGCMLMHFSTADADTQIGDNVLLNINAIVGHDCRVGSHSHISGNVTLCGGAAIGEGVWVGAGATIRQRIHVADGAFVGLNATVVKDVQPGDVVYNPVAAQPRRESMIVRE